MVTTRVPKTSPVGLVVLVEGDISINPLEDDQPVVDDLDWYWRSSCCDTRYDLDEGIQERPACSLVGKLY